MPSTYEALGSVSSTVSNTVKTKCPIDHYPCDVDNQLVSFLLFLLFMCIGVLPWVLGPLKLELQIGVSCHVGARN